MKIQADPFAQLKVIRDGVKDIPVSDGSGSSAGLSARKR
jgi:hypothetical protein